MRSGGMPAPWCAAGLAKEEVMAKRRYISAKHRRRNSLMWLYAAVVWLTAAVLAVVFLIMLAADSIMERPYDPPTAIPSPAGISEQQYIVVQNSLELLGTHTTETTLIMCAFNGVANLSPDAIRSAAVGVPVSRELLNRADILVDSRGPFGIYTGYDSYIGIRDGVTTLMPMRTPLLVRRVVA